MARQLTALCKSTIQRYNQDHHIYKVTDLPYPLLQDITNKLRQNKYKKLFCRPTSLYCPEQQGYNDHSPLYCHETMCYDEEELVNTYLHIAIRPFWDPTNIHKNYKSTMDIIDEDLDFRMLTYWQFHHIMQQYPYTNTPWLKDNKNHIHIDYTTEIDYRHNTNRKICIPCTQELRRTNSNDKQIQYYGHTDHKQLDNINMLRYFYNSEHWCQRCGYRALFNVYTYEDCCWIRDYHRKNSSKQEFQRRKRMYNAPTDTSEDLS